MRKGGANRPQNKTGEPVKTKDNYDNFFSSGFQETY